MKTHLTGLVICILLGIVLMLGLNTIGWLARSLVQGAFIGLLMAAGQSVPADQALPRYIRDKVAKTTQERADERLAQATAGLA